MLLSAGLAKGEELVEACRTSKDYVTAFLASNDSLLGYYSRTELEKFYRVKEAL